MSMDEKFFFEAMDAVGLEPVIINEHTVFPTAPKRYLVQTTRRCVGPFASKEEAEAWRKGHVVVTESPSDILELEQPNG
jgi:hypothetical protein